MFLLPVDGKWIPELIQALLAVMISRVNDPSEKVIVFKYS